MPLSMYKGKRMHPSSFVLFISGRERDAQGRPLLRRLKGGQVYFGKGFSLNISLITEKKKEKKRRGGCRNGLH